MLEELDAVTHLPMRRDAELALTLMIERAINESGPLSLIQADVYKFHWYNHHNGHAQGDVRLREVAAAVKREAASLPEHLLWRTSDQFWLAAPASLEEAVRLAERIRARIEVEVAPLVVNVGVAGRPPGRGWTCRQLLEVADARRYNGRYGEGGKPNRVSVENPPVQYFPLSMTGGHYWPIADSPR